VLHSYARNFGLRVAVVRLFSVYGPGLRKQLLWDVCGRLAAGADVLELGGTGAELRDWFHVEDAARLICLAAERAASEPLLVNGGTGVAVPVRDIAQGLVEAMGRPVPVRFSGQSRHGDPERLVADTQRMQALGFAPQRGWREGLAEFAAWYQSQGSAALRESP